MLCIHPVMCIHLCHAQVACHSLLSEAASHGHVAMVKTLCQKYQCDPMDAVKVLTANLINDSHAILIILAIFTGPVQY